MRRTPFRRPALPRTRAAVIPIPADLRARIDYGPAANSGPVTKAEHVEHAGYRCTVASLRCIACGVVGLSQCAHPNTGKAAGKKLIDDRLTFPLCCDTPGRAGCHPRFDQGAMFTKDVRRQIEVQWGRETRAAVRALGLWPADLRELE